MNSLISELYVHRSCNNKATSFFLKSTLKDYSIQRAKRDICPTQCLFDTIHLHKHVMCIFSSVKCKNQIVSPTLRCNWVTYYKLDQWLIVTINAWLCSYFRVFFFLFSYSGINTTILFTRGVPYMYQRGCVYVILIYDITVDIGTYMPYYICVCVVLTDCNRSNQPWSCF